MQAQKMSNLIPVCMDMDMRTGVARFMSIVFNSKKGLAICFSTGINPKR